MARADVARAGCGARRAVTGPAALAFLAAAILAGGCTAGTTAAQSPAAQSPAAQSPAATTPAATPSATPSPAASASAPGSAATAAPHGRAGWPVPQPRYLGRYRMTSSSDPGLARSGLLTLFLRPVKFPKPEVLPSGVLSLQRPGQTTVLYLTTFTHRGGSGSAEVSAGNYGYQPVGQVRVAGLRHGDGVLTLRFRPATGQPVTLSFSRVSRDPQP